MIAIVIILVFVIIYNVTFTNIKIYLHETICNYHNEFKNIKIEMNAIALNASIWDYSIKQNKINVYNYYQNINMAFSNFRRQCEPN